MQSAYRKDIVLKLFRQQWNNGDSRNNCKPPRAYLGYT